jgi:hypothetical protein
MDDPYAGIASADPYAGIASVTGKKPVTPAAATQPSGFQHLSDAASLVASHPFTTGAGMLENAASGIGGSVGKLGGRLADLVTGTPNNRSESWQQALQYQPRTAAGQQIQQLTGQEGQVLGQQYDQIKGANTPLGQTLKSAVPEALTDIGMLAGLRGAGKQGAAPEAIPAVPPTPKQAAAFQAQQSGYVVPPSLANPTFTNRLLGGIAGKAKVVQGAQDVNQSVTNGLAAKYLQQNPQATLTPSLLDQVRTDAYTKGYQPIQSLGEMTAQPQLASTLDGLVASASKAKQTFPGIKVPDDGVAQTLEAIKAQPKYDADGALSTIRFLRDQSDMMYRQGNNAAGKAYKGAAKALEDDIEANLAAAGPDAKDLLGNYRNARQLIARTYTVGKGLVGDTGDVDAVKLANSTKGKGYVSDELKQITSLANNFRKVAKVPQEGSESISPLDMYGAGATAILSHSALPFAYPLTRAGMQSFLLSPKGQMRAVPRGVRQGLLTPAGTPSLLGQ